MDDQRITEFIFEGHPPISFDNSDGSLRSLASWISKESISILADFQGAEFAQCEILKTFTSSVQASLLENLEVIVLLPKNFCLMCFRNNWQVFSG